MPPLIFPHVGASGGATFIAILKPFFQNSYNIDNWDLQELGTIPTEVREQIQFLYGHMPFGAHSFFKDGGAYISIARNPVIRAVSEYYYWYFKEKKEGIDYFSSFSLHSFFESGQGTNNFHCLVFSGLITTHNDVKVNDAVLALAKANIEKHFFLVGTIEMLDETLILLRNLFGFDYKYICYKNILVSNDRPPLREISKETIRLIEEKNAYDIELYDFIKRKLVAKMEELGSVFDDDLSLFRKYREKFLIGE